MRVWSAYTPKFNNVKKPFMEFDQSEENQEVTVSKFESMLKTNSVFFFDSNEFENIIHHYLESGKIALAKKAIKLGNNKVHHVLGLEAIIRIYTSLELEV